MISFLAGMRARGRYPEDVYESLGFGSVEAMRAQLRNWGLPEWIAGAPDAAPPANERKARRGGGGGVRIPLSEGVALLRKAADELERKSMRIEAGRFVAEHSLYGVRGKEVLTEGAEGEAVRVYWREKVSPRFWRELCEKRGLDPDDPLRNHVMEPADVQRREGASPAPPGDLEALVANYVLTGGDVEELLNAVHPDPDGVDRAKLFNDDAKRPGPVHGLRTYARQLATVVLGGAVRPGRPGPGVSSHEHRAAAYAQQRHRQGATDEEILAEFRGGAIHPPPAVATGDEVKRLRSLKLD